MLHARGGELDELLEPQFRKELRQDTFINPYPVNMENMVSSLIMPENIRLDLTWRLKD